MMHVSVVVPARNEADHLERCLDALFSQAQGDYEYEVIVVDGHSTDGTRDLAAAYPVRVAVDGRTSVGEARNRGIAAARGDVVAFTDADCVPAHDWIARLTERFRAGGPGLGGVGGAIRVARDGRFIPWYEDAYARAHYRGFITSNVAYRREALLKIGGFDQALVCGEDWDVWWRARDAGWRVAFAPDVRVTHAPVENASAAAYWRKQFWYAREDVPVFAKRLAAIAARRRAGLPVASVESTRILTPSLASAFGAGALAFAPLSATVGGVGLIALGVPAVERTVKAARLLPEVRRAWARFLAFSVGKSVVRGAGTVTGAVALAAGVPGRRVVKAAPVRARRLLRAAGGRVPGAWSDRVTVPGVRKA